jgi:phosphoribosyl 1,2-cyclic phosphodiesterase
MNVYCLASSSKGNSYIIQNDTTTLLVEAGLDFNTTRSRLTSLNIKTSDIDAILITHKHGDHLNKKTVSRFNVPVISNDDVINSIDHNLKWLAAPFARLIIKDIKIIPFELDHDVKSYGYIIEDMNSGNKLLFINDTEFVRWNFEAYNFKTIMIECNHMHDLIKDIPVYRQRSIKSHMSLYATIKTLKSLNLSATESIYLMHLSDGYSNQEIMKKEVEKATGIPTYVCGKNGGYS